MPNSSKELMSLKDNLNVLGKTKESKKTCSVPVKKEITKIDEDGNKIVETISYKIKFIDSMRFMTTSLSKLLDSLTEWIHKIKCKDCSCFLEYESVKDNLIKYECLSYNKEYWNKLNEKSKKKFKNALKFSNNDINKFILLLKGVYPYEYMDDCKKFNQTTLPEKEKFYSTLRMEDITEANYKHEKRVCKDFEIKNWGEYHLYLRSDALRLPNVFENFRNKCIKIYELDPLKFLKKDRGEIRIINWHWYVINGWKRN